MVNGELFLLTLMCAVGGVSTAFALVMAKTSFFGGEEARTTGSMRCALTN